MSEILSRGEQFGECGPTYPNCSSRDVLICSPGCDLSGESNTIVIVDAAAGGAARLADMDNDGAFTLRRRDCFSVAAFAAGAAVLDKVAFGTGGSLVTGAGTELTSEVGACGCDLPDASAAAGGCTLRFGVTVSVNAFCANRLDDGAGLLEELAALAAYLIVGFANEKAGRFAPNAAAPEPA